MSTEYSKSIIQRLRSLRFLLAALLGQQGVHVTQALGEQVLPDLPEGQDAPDFLSSVRALGQRLDAVMDRLSEADLEVFRLKGRLRYLGRRRDDLVSRLAAAIVRLRRLVLARYESPDLDTLALKSPRSYRSTPLLSQAGHLVRAFAGENLEILLGEAVYDDVVNLRVPVGLVDELTAELWAVLDEINDARRGLEEALIEKNELQDEYDRLFLNTARAFEAFCRLAGKTRLAEKVRPSKRRPGRMEVEPPEDVEGEQVPASMDSSDPISTGRLVQAQTVRPRLPAERPPAPEGRAPCRYP